jgi:hypothetical protein
MVDKKLSDFSKALSASATKPLGDAFARENSQSIYFRLS